MAFDFLYSDLIILFVTFALWEEFIGIIFSLTNYIAFLLR